MKRFQLPLNSRGGVLRSEPRILGNETIVLAHAMDRPPDLAVFRCQNIVSNNGWMPGEAWSLIYQASDVGGTEFTLAMAPGKITLVLDGASMNFPNRTDPTAGGGLITFTSWKYELICIWLAPLPASQ